MPVLCLLLHSLISLTPNKQSQKLIYLVMINFFYQWNQSELILLWNIHCYPDVFQILGSLICRHLHVVNVLGLVLKLLWSVLLSTHQPNGIVCKHLNNHCISHQLILALYKFIGVCHICQIHFGITFVYQMVHQDLLLQWRNGFQCSWWWVFETALIMWKCWNGRNEEVNVLCFSCWC